LLLTRVLTAAALLAAFLSALWFLDRIAFSMLVAGSVAIAGYEWALLGKSRRPIAWAYGVLCALLVIGLLQVGAAVPWVFDAAGIFWIAVVPVWLARGVG